MADRSIDGLHADLLVNRLQPGDPQPGFLVAGLRLARLLPVIFSFACGRLAAVAVVRLVVDDHDLAVLAQVAADAVHHLVGRFGERAGRVGGEDALGQPARVALLAQLEGVEVGDDDLRRAQVAAVLRGTMSSSL